jgi:hypothetical protein
VFEENELHYKALIEIYEEHMAECPSLNDENVNVANGSFAKKKNHQVLTHSEWKKI